ncbi:MAG: CBS domain-containing protein [Gemmatimonadaceae bacterium]|nr:CBS domain-containing protein [Gemmatimonadaceae bacterium]
MTTDVVTVSPTTTLRQAAELFAQRHIGGAPVVDGQQVVGVVSATDILTFAATAPPPRETEGDTDDEWVPPSDETTWDADDDAASFFADRWVYSESDTVDYFAESTGQPGVALDGHTVSEVMTQGILSLAPGTDGAVAAERMRTSDVHRLLVMRDGALVGILSTTDLARAIADRRVGKRTYVFDRRR